MLAMMKLAEGCKVCCVGEPLVRGFWYVDERLCILRYSAFKAEALAVEGQEKEQANEVPDGMEEVGRSCSVLVGRLFRTGCLGGGLEIKEVTPDVRML